MLDLEAIKARVFASTQGAWSVSGYPSVVIEAPDGKYREWLPNVDEGDSEYPEAQQMADAALMANSGSDILDLVREVNLLREALIWCGGSQDFQLEGVAYEGWQKVVMPLLYPDTNPR
jgi:hypothetical protein